MLLKCLSNTIDPQTYKHYYHDLDGYSVNMELPLIPSKCYIVYGFNDVTHPRVCIFDEERRYPMWYAISFFEVIDPRLSRFWDLYEDPYNKLYAIPTWIKDDGTYDHIDNYNYDDYTVCDAYDTYGALVDGDPRQQSIFKTYQAKIDLEFVDCEDRPKVDPIDGTWVQCPTCADVWEITPGFELSQCPQCKKIIIVV